MLIAKFLVQNMKDKTYKFGEKDENWVFGAFVF